MGRVVDKKVGDLDVSCPGLLGKVLVTCFLDFGTYLPCPGEISKPTGAKNSGTEAGMCHRFC